MENNSNTTDMDNSTQEMKQPVGAAYVPPLRTPSGKIAVMVDASLLRHAGCLRHLNWVMRGWTVKSINYKALYGVALHKGLQVYYTMLHPYKLEHKVPSREALREIVVKAVAAAVDFWKPFQKEVPMEEMYQTPFIEPTLLAYSVKYIHDPMIELLGDLESGPLIEQRFSIPAHELGLVDKDVLPEHEIVLCGTIDLPCLYAGLPTVVDHKTTSSTNIPSKLVSYELDVQMFFYSLMWQKLAKSETPPNVLINGLFLRNPGPRNTSTVSLERSNIVSFSKDRMEQFERWLVYQLHLIEDLIKADGQAVIMGNPTQCNKGYPSCEFARVCRQDSKNHSLELRTQCSRRVYNPFAFND